MVSNPSTKVKTEAIDEVILRLLGLKPGVEIDYQTYFEILKKKLAIARLAGKELPREEDELLREELKRVRRVKDKGIRIKIKEAKTKVASVGVGPGVGPGVSTGSVKPKSGAIVKAKTAKIIPQSVIPVNVKDITEKKEERVSRFDGIKKTLDSILAILSSKLKFDKKQSETDRKEKETQRRTKREEGLEGFRKGISAVSGAAKKLLAPFQSIIDRIWRFIFFTLLGRAFTQLMEWLGDPKNKKKIESLGRFLKDWWPALAFAAGLFLTPFGKFIRTTITLLRGFIPQILKIIPRLTAFAAANPVATAAVVAAVGGTVGGIVAEKNLKRVDETLLQRRVQEAKDKGKPLSKQEIEKIKTEQLQKRIEDIRGTNIPGSAWASGGLIPRFTMGGMNPKVFDTGYEGIDGSTGQRVSGFGPDTQQIIAQPGEIVINKPTVDAVGADHFLGLNRTYGGPGANKPKMGRIQTAAAGGMVLQKFQSGGMVGMQGGGTPVRAENPKMSSSRAAWDSLNTVRTPLKVSMQEAQERIIDRQAQRNTNINTNIRPWWERLNPFADKRRYSERLPSHNPASRNYNMPGYNKNKWLELNKFRTDPKPGTHKPNPLNPKSRFAPSYQKPGVNRPLMLQGGGEVRRAEQKANKLIDQNFPQTYADYMEQVEYGFVEPMSPEDMQREIERQKRDKKMEMIRQFLQYQQYGNKKYQGGGEVEALERTYKQGQMSGANPEALKAIGDEAFLLKHFGPGGVWRHFKGSGATDYRGNIIPKKEGGGAFSRKITESTGLDIPGATADRQLVALQPGENHYIIPKDSVTNGAIPLIDKVVAMTDPDSNPAKLGYRSKDVPNITPLPRGGAGGMGGMITLPPITQSASGVGNPGNSSGAGSRAPVFSAVSASGMRQQQENASMYGIVG